MIHGYKSIDERLKYRYLIAGIKSGALNSVKSTILVSAPYRQDYDASVILYRYYINQAQDVNVGLNIPGVGNVSMSNQVRGTSLLILKTIITRRKYTRSSQIIKGGVMQTYAINADKNL